MSEFGDPSSVHLFKYETEEAVPYERDKDTWDVEGGFGAVFRYTERNGGEPVAVKRIKYDGVNSTEKRAKWKETVEHEISLLKFCNHRNLAKFVAAYLIEEHSNCYFIVMKPWAPITLKSLVLSVDSTGRSSKCSWWNKSSRIHTCHHSFEGLIEGLAYLHDHHIFHKDIKPENILFYGRTPIITDFGVSKLYRPNAHTKFTNSTFDFLAPEQIAHEYSGPICDIFALGCCFLWHFLAATGGSQPLDKLFDLVQEASCQYGKELTSIYPFLRQHLVTSYCSPIGFGFLIREMLLYSPEKRPTARAVKALLGEIRHGGNIDSSEVACGASTLTLAQILHTRDVFDDSSLPLLSARHSPDSLRPTIRPRVYFLRPNRSGNEISTILSVDMGSDLNIISSTLLDELRRAGYEFSSTCVLHGQSMINLDGTKISVDHKVRLELRIDVDGTGCGSLAISDEFAVLHDCETYFSILLGETGIFSLQSKLGILPGWTNCQTPYKTLN